MEFNIAETFAGFFAPVFAYIRNFLLTASGTLLLAVTFYLAGFFLLYKVNPLHMTADYLESLDVKFKYYDLLRWLLWDFLTREERRLEFKPFGFTIFVGRQGAGKTISMVRYLNDMKVKYPDCFIVTNFQYTQADFLMKDWRDLLEIRNDALGVIFAIDEIHSEYSAEAWRDFPENLLSEISQQRKQKVKIVATSQVYSRVAKPIREQCFSVVICSTYFGRFSINKEYDASEFATADTPYQVKKKCKPSWSSRFVQSNHLRRCYDTYEKIERMKKLDFIPRGERGR